MGPATNCPVNGGTLAANAQCSVSVIFAPASTGTKSAVLSFSDNAGGSPQTVALSGTGTIASMSVSPASINFSPQTLQVPTAAQSVKITNAGGTAIQISAITVGGANPADFPQTNNCPGTLNPSASCQVNTVFQPTSGGTRAATLSISDDAAGSPQAVTLSGMGLVPSAALSVASLSFNSQLVGTTSAAEKVGVTNTGNGGLVISGLTFSGPNATEFAATHNCGKMLAPNSSCNVSVTFVPTAAGAGTATLNINDNAPDSPQSVTVTGAATDFSLAAQTGEPLSAVVTAGTTATYNL